MKEFEMIQARDREIEELKKKLSEREAEVEKLKADIRDKYQSYIDNYESIGSLVYDAKIRSEQMIRDAEEQRRSPRRKARNRLQRRRFRREAHPGQGIAYPACSHRHPGPLLRNPLGSDFKAKKSAQFGSGGIFIPPIFLLGVPRRTR